MKFEEVLPSLKKGKRVRRNYFDEGKYIEVRRFDGFICDNYDIDYTFCLDDLNADDWEIIKETKKVKLRDLTWEQYIKWVDNNCLEYNNYCDKCPFQKVKCEKDGGQNSLWINNKDLYSDKFLNQEIEIEEE